MNKDLQSEMRERASAFGISLFTEISTAIPQRFFFAIVDYG